MNDRERAWHKEYQKGEKYKAYQREYQREYMRAYRKSHPEMMRYIHIKKKYGLSREDYEAMLLEQEGKCLICGKDMNPSCVDHDHETDEIRGLLCSNCNVMLAMSHDNPSILRAGADYLEDGD
jgi:hypothetical protein